MPKPAFLRDDGTGKIVVDDIGTDPVDAKDDEDTVVFVDDKAAEPNDSVKDDVKDDIKDAEPFSGFAGAEGGGEPGLTAVLDRLDALEQRVLKAQGQGALEPATPEEFAQIAKDDPEKALTLVVTKVLKDQGIETNSEEVAKRAVQEMSAKQDLNDYRKVISERFDPEKNSDLAEKAQAIYDNKKKRGMTLEMNPAMEYESFVMAIEQDPELRPKERAGGNSRRAADAQPSKGSNRKGQQIEVTSKMRQIADKWDVDISNPNVARMITRLSREYDERRTDVRGE